MRLPDQILKIQSSDLMFAFHADAFMYRNTRKETFFSIVIIICLSKTAMISPANAKI